MADVFISYAREDRAKLDKIASAFEALEVSYFVDSSMAAGTIFDEVLSAELQAAKAVLVVWTSKALASKWVRAEASFALEHGKLVAVFLDKVILVPPFNLVHAADLIQWSGDLDDTEFVAMLRRIGDLCAKPHLPEVAVRLQNKIKDLEPAVLRMLEPLLKKWLDSHLPTIVEQKVERELERITKLAR